MGIDYIRTAYRAKMRVWRGSEEEIEVRWFRAPEGAKLLPGPHPWGSWYSWDRKDGLEPDELGERAYVGYDKGENPLGYKGTAHCGPVPAVKDGGTRGVDPVITTAADGGAACCFLPVVGPCGRYPQHLTAEVESTFTFCDCGAPQVLVFHFVETAQLPELGGNIGHRWQALASDSPHVRFGNCSWPSGPDTLPVYARWDAMVPHAGTGVCTPHVRLRFYLRDDAGNFFAAGDHLIALTQFTQNPLLAVGGFQWQATNRPLCGLRFGVPGNAQLVVTLTGAEVPE